MKATVERDDRIQHTEVGEGERGGVLLDTERRQIGRVDDAWTAVDAPTTTSADVRLSTPPAGDGPTTDRTPVREPVAPR